jgi:membrane protein
MRSTSTWSNSIDQQAKLKMPGNSYQQSAAAPSISERLYSRLSAERAKADLERLERITHRGTLGVVRAAIVGFTNHNDTLWASALTYTFSLSLVPILAVALSAVKGLIGAGVIESFIEQYLAVKSPEVTNRILQYVGHINAATLGTLGGATLLVTVLLTLGTVEQALNIIFNVPQPRTWLRKFTDYLSITFTIPLLLTVAVSLKASFTSSLPRLPGAGWIAATLPVWAGFSFLYLFFPNRRVRIDCAALGGLVAAIALEIGQWAYIKFQVSAGRYDAIYGGLAAVPVLLTWIYIAWTIVLAGAEVAAAAQGTETGFSLDYRAPAFVRTAMLLTVFRTAERALTRNAPACTIDSLANELDAPPAALRPIISQLQNAGIIVEISSDSNAPRAGLFLARDSSELTLAEVYGDFLRIPDDIHGDERICGVLKVLSTSERENLSGITVKDLVLGRFGQPHDRDGKAAEANPQ